VIEAEGAPLFHSPGKPASLDIDKGPDISLFANHATVAANATMSHPAKAKSRPDGKNMLLHKKTLEVGCGQLRSGFIKIYRRARSRRRRSYG
jgi:hypothetical protein